MVAQIIITVADHDNHAAYFGIRPAGRRRIQEFLGGPIDSIVQSGSPSGALPADRSGQQAEIAGVILDNFGFVIEGHQKSHVFVPADYTVEEINRGVLFEREAGPDAIGGVEQHPDAQRQVGFAPKEPDVLRRVVLENLEVALFEIGDEIMAAIGDGGD